MNFTKTFFITTFILLSLALGFIYSIDPYDKYGINVFGFETKAVAMARENKFNMLEHTKKKYDAFIIGSSSAHRLHTDDVEKYTGLKTFNYSVQQTTPEDYLAITRHILSRQNPKMIMLQMDFYTLNKNFDTDTRFFTSPLYPYLSNKSSNKPVSPLIDSDYVTLKALSDSFKVIWVNLFGEARHLYLENGNYHIEKPYHGPVKLNQFQYFDYQFDEKRIGLLKEIKKLCLDKNIKLIVWTTPYAFVHLDHMKDESGLVEKHKEFKKILVNVFGEVYDFSNKSIEAYSTDQYYRDSTHPTREMFQLMLEKVFQPEKSRLPAPLGMKLSH